MTDPSTASVAERWRVVADGFSQRVAGVPAGGWDRPTPCEGWVARDVVGHLVGWVPPFLRDGAGVDLAVGAVGDDPSAAWLELSAAVQAVLDDPGVGERTFDHPMAGTAPLDQAIDRFILGDVLVHTWDLARATGQDERLEPSVVAAMAAGLEPLGDLLERSGQYGPRVAVPAGADEQTRLLALTGRRST